MQAFGTKVGLSEDSSSPKRKPIEDKRNVVNVLLLLLNIIRPGYEEKGKTTFYRTMSFGTLFANVSSDLRLLLLDARVCKVRHFGFSSRRRVFLASRVQYYPNSDSRFQLMRVIVSGDIESNPGPKNCSVCNKVIAKNH